MNTVKKLLKAIAIASVISIALYVGFVAFMLHIFSFNGYQKERKDLYTVAVNNIFGARGYHSNGEVSYSPKIYVLETDDYGRTLFFYSEYHDYSIEPQEDYGMAFVIMQSSKDGYAYYYPDQCYMPYFDVESDWESIREKLPPDYLDSLKENNDWNLELSEEKCAKVKISKKKPKGNLRLKNAEFEKLIDSYELKNGYSRTDTCFYKSHIFCESDQYGRELYYVYGITNVSSRYGENVSNHNEYAIIFNADGSCSENGIIKISTPLDSVAAIRELKQNCNWNKAS